MELFFRDTGSGNPIIILHGLYGQSDNWIQIARQLSNHFRVILPDHRNHGSSPHSEEHSYTSMSNDLLELMDKLSISKAIIVGHSMGGKVAINFASQYPNRVSSLIIADIAPKNYLEVAISDNHQQNHKKILSALNSLNLEQLKSRKEADYFLSNEIESPLLRQFLLKNLRRNNSNIFEWKINVPVLLSNLDNILQDVNYSWLNSSVTQPGYPITFIYGENSDYLQTDDIKKISEFYPQAKFIGIPNAAHWLHAEQPVLFLEAVISAIKQS